MSPPSPPKLTCLPLLHPISPVLSLPHIHLSLLPYLSFLTPSIHHCSPTPYLHPLHLPHCSPILTSYIPTHPINLSHHLLSSPTHFLPFMPLTSRHLPRFLLLRLLPCPSKGYTPISSPPNDAKTTSKSPFLTSSMDNCYKFTAAGHHQTIMM